MSDRYCLLFAVLLFMAGSARGQIIYLPVQYQYGTQNTFYYGGNDPAVIARASMPVDAGGNWGRTDGYAFVSGDVRVHREVSNEPLRVYSDAIPEQNAHLFGYTISDAANEANASVPRYFRKADVIAAAGATPGVLIVPAQAVLAPTTRPSAPSTEMVRVTPSTLPK
ncbi:MAG: hypothetical protein JO353_05800, partial [Phycisphaerae bacterium]|nr:hypothetical protein [Phycisphaerae bacterium]